MFECSCLCYSRYKLFIPHLSVLWYIRLTKIYYYTSHVKSTSNHDNIKKRGTSLMPLYIKANTSHKPGVFNLQPMGWTQPVEPQHSDFGAQHRLEYLLVGEQWQEILPPLSCYQIPKPMWGHMGARPPPLSPYTVSDQSQAMIPHMVLDADQTTSLPTMQPNRYWAALEPSHVAGLGLASSAGSV